MFPERLRALRKGQKITLKELANHLNQNLGPNEKPNTASQIGNWERGIRTPSYVDLGKLFFSSKNLSFNQTVLSSEDRYEIFQLIDGYLKGKHNRRDTDKFYGKQEQLNLKLK